MTTAITTSTTMGSEDAEIVRQVWDSYLPVAFRLDPEEEASLHAPQPHYTMVSRLSYFPLVLEKALKHLLRSEEKRETGDLWLESDGTPLKWHYPVGVLFDLLGACIPWTVTIHFRHFPEHQLVRCQSRAAVEAHLIHALKESDALRNRSQVMSSLQKKDHNQLWLGVCNDKFDQFWAVNRKLNASDPRYVPLRVHARDQTVRQKLVKPVMEGRETTLADAVDAVLGADAAGKRILIHGLEVPPETPLLWLSKHMSHCDNFVHICAL